MKKRHIHVDLIYLQSYIVVPHLNNLLSPTGNRSNSGLAARHYPMQETYPDPQYSYLERIRSHAPAPSMRRVRIIFLYRCPTISANRKRKTKSNLEKIRKTKKNSLRFQEPSDYLYIRRNEAFANRFIEDFINKTIEDQLIPDLLLEVIGEIDREVKFCLKNF